MNKLINWAPEEQELNREALALAEAEAEAEVKAARAALKKALSHRAVVAEWRQLAQEEGAI